jgi:hypothetical protein
VSDSNVDRLESDFELDEPPIRARAIRLGLRTGAQQLRAPHASAERDGAE